jgi:hypothetical protein
MTPRAPLRRSASPRWTFRAGLSLALLLAFAGAGCRSIRPTRARAGSTAAPFTPPKLELPQLVAPAPLPAARVLHLFFVSNVTGDLEPCG